MFQLYVLRHGKSDWDADYKRDWERPLAARGRKAANRIGHFLAERGVEPAVVVTSPAVRAHTTLRRVADAAGWKTVERIDDRLYGASPGEVLDVVGEHRKRASSILVCGHEPWCSGVVGVLTGDTPRFPTATVACLEVDRLEPGGARLVWLQRPRELD